MKALSVTQPWASVICSGMKDVENRLWQAAEAPGRILIHATKAKVPGNWENCPDDMVSAVKNSRLMGWIPEYKDMPYGSIIGYVDCYKIVKDSDSFWAQPDSFHWCLRDAYLFDKPIPGINGVRGHLFDVPEVDVNNLPPAHKVDLAIPYVKDKDVFMPASDAVLNDIEAGADNVCYDSSDALFELFINPESGEQIEYKKIHFVGKNKTIVKTFDGVDSAPYLGPGDKPLKIIGLEDLDLYWSYFAVYFK